MQGSGPGDARVGTGYGKGCVMGDTLLNGRPAEDWELAAIARGRRCDLERDREQLKGLLAEYPREPSPVSRPVPDLPVLP
jgi:hypothetical protein